MRVRMALGFAVAAVVALIWAMLPGAASAGESNEGTDSEAVVDVETVSDFRTITLQPGDNFVGWVSDAVAVEKIFDAIPDAALIYRWDVESRTWRYAIRGVGGPLTVLEPGMAVQVRIIGDDPLEWAQPVTPARGLVKLRNGQNWVAWSGRDNWTVDKVVKGIGKSLTEVRMGDLVYDPSNPESLETWPTIKRGDALEVSVSRDTRWLQPTGVMPKIAFEGSFSNSVRDQYIDMTREVIDLYAHNYGIEADPTVLEWVAFHETGQAGLSCIGGVATRDFASVNVGSGRSYQTGAEYLLAHEYFHVLENHLSGEDYLSDAPQWIIEGQADWFAHELLGEPHNTHEGTHCDNVSLREAQFLAPQQCHYLLGELAASALAEFAGSDALFEYWREMAPQSIGPNGQWELGKRWEDAFAIAFGLSTEEFYAQFSAERNSVAAAEERGQDLADDTPVIEGYVLDREGHGAPGVLVVFSEPSARSTSSMIPAITDAEGKFVVKWTGGSEYQVKVYPEDYQLKNLWTWEHTFEGCGYWIGDTDPTLSRHLAKRFSVQNSTKTPLFFRLSSELCARKIEGRIVSPQAGPLAGVRVRLVDLAGDPSSSGLTHKDGTFALSANASRSYWLAFDFKPPWYVCQAYYEDGEITTGGQPTQILVSESDVTGLQVNLEADVCSILIHGELVDSNGVALNSIDVTVEREDGGFVGSVKTSTGGVFSIPVPEAGTYRIYASVARVTDEESGRYTGCNVYYRNGDGTTNVAHAARIRAVESGVAGLRFQIPRSVCGNSISGRLLDANGEGVGGTWLYTEHGYLPVRKVRTEADGSFSITALDANEYRFYAWVGGCRIHFGEDGPVSYEWDALRIDASGSDVTGIEFRLPEDPGSFCG